MNRATADICSEAYQAKVKNVWKRFVAGKPIPEGIVPPYVLKGWELSRKNGVDPVGSPPPPLLGKKEIEAMRLRHHDLLTAAEPILHMLAISIQDTEYIATLSVASGHVLAVVGDGALANHAKRQHNVVGAHRSVSLMGVTAMSLSMIERTPLSLIGHEHYCSHEHDWKCFAAPIFNENDTAVASLTISSHISSRDIHTLMLAQSCAACISIRLRENALMEQQKRLNAMLRLVYNSLPEAVFAVQADGGISHANSRAVADILGSEISSAGFHLDRLLGAGDLPRALQTLRKGTPETLRLPVRTHKGIRTCFCRFEPILIDNKELSGATLSITTEKQLVDQANQISGNKAYFTFDNIRGKSASLRRQIDIAKNSAKSNSRVLIYGESGTGKELFAQAIHNACFGRNKPFVAVSCAAIPRDLIESELFGYVEGAFSGARKGGMVGKIEMADGGSLFLDEINSLPLDMQAKLLRVLQQMEVVRVGGSYPIPVNVRVISATNKKLLEAVHQETFRQDLYFRLNVVEIVIPPLRERKEDIGLLAGSFLQRLSAKMDRPAPRPAPATLRALEEYSWPGNVRELENVCERALILTPGDTIALEHLPQEISGGGPARKSGGEPAWGADRTAGGIMEVEGGTVDDVYAALIRTTLSAYNGNYSKAAERLGVSRSTLYRKMRAWGMKKQNIF